MNVLVVDVGGTHIKILARVGPDKSGKIAGFHLEGRRRRRHHSGSRRHSRRARSMCAYPLVRRLALCSINNISLGGRRSIRRRCGRNCRRAIPRRAHGLCREGASGNPNRRSACSTTNSINRVDQQALPALQSTVVNKPVKMIERPHFPNQRGVETDLLHPIHDRW
jgi:hypothetical protein